MAKPTRAELGPADVVIYNVGARPQGPIVEQDAEEFVSVWRICASAA